MLGQRFLRLFIVGHDNNLDQLDKNGKDLIGLRVCKLDV